MSSHAALDLQKWPIGMARLDQAHTFAQPNRSDPRIHLGHGLVKEWAHWIRPQESRVRRGAWQMALRPAVPWLSIVDTLHKHWYGRTFAWFGDTVAGWPVGAAFGMDSRHPMSSRSLLFAFA